MRRTVRRSRPDAVHLVRTTRAQGAGDRKRGVGRRTGPGPAQVNSSGSGAA